MAFVVFGIRIYVFKIREFIKAVQNLIVDFLRKVLSDKTVRYAGQLRFFYVFYAFKRNFCDGLIPKPIGALILGKKT